MPLNFGPTLDGDIKAVLLDADRVAHRVKELGAEISRDYVDKARSPCSSGQPVRA
ncbi:hpt [Symbiodinium microadriaticum]|nr:hpt [Symbiodinium microadriaticum]